MNCLSLITFIGGRIHSRLAFRHQHRRFHDHDHQSGASGIWNQLRRWVRHALGTLSFSSGADNDVDLAVYCYPGDIPRWIDCHGRAAATRGPDHEGNWFDHTC